MSEAQYKRIDVGFSGGQAITIKLTDREYDSFRNALRNASGWHELETPDGPLSLDLRQVVFVKTEEPEHAVGFSGL